jgi:hypothetical protein
MILLLILLAGAVFASIMTVRAAVRDGHAWQRPPDSRVEDPRFRAPAG